MINFAFALRRVLHLNPGICHFDADGLVCRIADRKGGLEPAAVEGEEEKISKANLFRNGSEISNFHPLVYRLRTMRPILTSAAACSAVGLFETRDILLARQSIVSSTRTSCRPLRSGPYIVNATCLER